MEYVNKKLRDLDSLNDHFLNAIPVPLICIDSINRNILAVNQQFKDQFGVSDIIIGKTFDDLFELQLPFGSPDLEEYTYRFQPSKNRSYIVTTKHKWLPTDHQNLEMISVTPTVKNPAGSRITNKKINKIQNAPPSGVIWIDDHFNIVNASYTSYQIWGFNDHKDLIQKPFSELFTDKKTYGEILKNLSKFGFWEGVLMSNHLIHEPFPLQLNIERAKMDNIAYKWMVTCVNLSSLSNLENELSIARTRTDNIAMATPNCIIISDNNGKIAYCNKQTEALFGYRIHELIGQDVEILMPEKFRQDHYKMRENYSKNPVMRPMGSGLPLQGKRKDGTIIPIDISLGPFMENGQKFIIVVIHDISQHKKAQDRLESDSRYIRLLHELSIIDNQSNSIKELLEASLASCSRYLNWPVGHAYLPANDGSGDYIPSGNWYLNDEKRFRAFKSITMQTRFTSGKGMIGKVIQTGKPQWVENCQDNPEYLRRFNNLDLAVLTGFAIPVKANNQLVGILEFYCDKSHTIDESLLEKMVTIGNQIGSVIDRIQSRNELVKSETKLKTIFHSSRDAILLTDGTYLLDFNKKAEQLLDLDQYGQEKIELSTIFLNHQKDAMILAESLKKTLKKAQAKEILKRNWVIYPKVGKKLNIEVDFIPYIHEYHDHILIYIKDITTRIKTEKLIRRNVKLFRQLFYNSPVGIVMLDHQGRVINSNKSFSNIFGYTLREMKGKVLNDLIVPNDQLEKAQQYNDMAQRGESFRAEETRLHKDGSTRSVVMGGASVIIDNKVDVLYGVYVDITDRILAENEVKKLNEELEGKVQKRTQDLTLINDELQAFSYSVSHDLRAPLRGIDGFSHALEEFYSDVLDDKGLEYLGRIRKSAQKMGNLIDEVISLAKVSRSELKLMNINLTDMAKSIIRQFQSIEPDRKIEIIIEPNMVDYADPTLIEMVLQNLLGNAWKYTGNKEVGRIEFGTIDDESFKGYYVRDNGVGFDEKYSEDIFTPFKRLHTESEFEGTGIGLSTVKRIIHRHHGTIIAKGKVGQGASFYFNIKTG